MSSPAMVGRQADLSWLEGMLEEARNGAPRTVVLGGEAGIGKTRLLREFAAGLGPDVRLLRGQCVDLGEVAAPYAPVKAALRALVADLGAEAVLDAVGPGRAAILAVLPELQAAAPEASLPSVGGAAATGQLHEAIAVLLETLSRDHVIVLAIEDLHWIDMASLALLRFLMRALMSSRVLILLTFRTEDVGRGHPVRGFLSEIERDRWVARRELSRLTKSQVRKLARQLVTGLPTDHLVDSIYRRSEGVPFFIEELVGIEGCSDGEMPDTLRDLLLARYERLPETTQQLLRLISTGGVRVSHSMLVQVHQGDVDELERGAREAVIAGVLTVDGDDYVFRHALVREAILDDLLPGERGRFHARYAEAYEALAATGTRRLAAEISFHWLGARDAERAFPATMQAMGEARAAAAYATAAQLGERAIELWPVVSEPERFAGMDKIELMSRTASHLRNAGENERSLALIKAALDECPDDRLQVPRLLRDQALTLASLGRPGARQLLEQALARLDGADDPITRDLRATVLSALAGRHMVAGDAEAAIRYARESLAIALELEAARTASVAMNINAVSLSVLGSVEESLETFEESRVLAAGDPPAMLRYWVNVSDMHYLIGRHREAVEFAEAGLERARAQGVERSTGVLLAGNAVDPLLALGEWDRADALIERGLALDPPLPFTVYMTKARIWSHLWRGDPDHALATLAPLRPVMRPMMQVESQTRLGSGRLEVEVRLETGDVDGAWAHSEDLFSDDIALPPGYAMPMLWASARVVAAGVRLPDGAWPAEVARERADRLREVFDRVVDWPITALWRAAFDAELSELDAPDARVEAWRAAIEAVGVPEAPTFLVPYATFRLAEAQLAAGDRPAARSTLQSARDLADDGGVGLVVQHVDRVARAAGLALTGPATSPEVGAGGVSTAGAAGAASTRDADGVGDPELAELTARERQVLDLIAEGLSNRQIGERLFISGKTASVHVSAILRKLGASTRTEAAVRVGALR